MKNDEAEGGTGLVGFFHLIPPGPSVIVIGPDRVGKTTLVKHLSYLIGIPAFKAPSEKQIFKDGGRSSLVFDYTLTHFLQQTDTRFISDRGYPCEWVYSKVFGRETDSALLKLIDDQHAKIDTRILYVFSSEEPKEEDDLVPRERYWDVVQGYNEFINWTGCDVITVNTKLMLEAFQNGGDISEHVSREVMEMLGFEEFNP